MNRSDHAREVRQSLTDPIGFCGKLGWLEGSKRQSRGVLIRCPSHGEKRPSCSVRQAPDGTIQLKCHACQWSGDALTMVAFAYSLSLREDFQEILAIGAELAGNLGLADEIRGRQLTAEERRSRPRLAAPAVSLVPPPEYPPQDELESLWRSCADPSTDAEVVKMLHARGIDFEAVSDLRLARVITPRTELPKWARYRGEAKRSRTWLETGHRLLLPAYDPSGTMRSVRAWRVSDGDTPKRLPPSGCRSTELVQANQNGLAMLRGQLCPLLLVILEGEPDFLTGAVTIARTEGAAVLGIGSGSWSENFAKKIPRGTEVHVGTHPDDAGDKYAAQVLETIGERCPVFRWRIAS